MKIQKNTLSMLALWIALSQTGEAVTRTFDGGPGGTGTNWGDAVNWSSDTMPVANTDDVTIGAFLVNVGGSRGLFNRTVLLNGATLSNGNLDFSNAGTVIASNVTFTSTMEIGSPDFVTLVNSTTANDNLNSWIVGVGGAIQTTTITGGSYVNNAMHVRPTDAGSVATLTLSGTFLSARQGGFGSASTAVGQSLINITNNSTFYITSATDFRWGGGAASSSTIVNLIDSTVRVGQQLTLQQFNAATTNMTLNVKNSTFLLEGFVAGDYLRNTLTSARAFDGEGLSVKINAENNGYQYEVSGRDLGTNFAGFHDNYSIDQLTGALRNSFHNNPNVQLTDTADNDLLPGNEALYVDKITLDPTLNSGGFEFRTGGRNIYYKKLVTNGKTYSVTGGGSLQQVKGADLMSTAPYAHMPDVQTATYGGPTLTLTNPSDYGTVIVTGAPNGGDLFVRLDVSGDATNITALASEIGANLVDGDLVLDYSRRPDGNNQFFDWSFAYRNVTVESILASAIPEPSTLLMVALVGGILLRRTRQS